jgi:hypothetical protein
MGSFFQLGDIGVVSHRSRRTGEQLDRVWLCPISSERIESTVLSNAGDDDDPIHGNPSSIVYNDI